MSGSWLSSECAFEHLWTELLTESTKGANIDVSASAAALVSDLQSVPFSVLPSTIAQTFTGVHAATSPVFPYPQSEYASEPTQIDLPTGIPPEATSTPILRDAPPATPSWWHVNPLDSGFGENAESPTVTGFARSARLRIKAPTYVFALGQHPLITSADKDGSETLHSNSSVDGHDDMSSMQEGSEKEVEILNPSAQVLESENFDGVSPMLDSDSTLQRKSQFNETARALMMAPTEAPKPKLPILQVPTTEIKRETTLTATAITAEAADRTIAEITASTSALASMPLPEAETFHLNVNSTCETKTPNDLLLTEAPCDVNSKVQHGNTDAVDLLYYHNLDMNALLQDTMIPVKSFVTSAVEPERQKAEEAEKRIAPGENRIAMAKSMSISTTPEAARWKGVDYMRAVTSEEEKQEKGVNVVKGCRWHRRCRHLWRRLRQSRVDTGPRWWWNENLGMWDGVLKEDVVGGIYINGTLTDPRQTNEIPLGDRQRRKEKLRKPSRFCHICLRRAERVTAVACTRLSTAHCRKVVCRRCFQEQGWDWGLATKRNSGWACSHCQKMYVTKEKVLLFTNDSPFFLPLVLTPFFDVLVCLAFSDHKKLTKVLATQNGHVSDFSLLYDYFVLIYCNIYSLNGGESVAQSAHSAITTAEQTADGMSH